MEAKVLFKDGYVRIQESTGEVFIYIEKPVVARTTVVCKDCGLPGVVGPNIDVNLKSVVDEICDDALVWAKSTNAFEYGEKE